MSSLVSSVNSTADLMCFHYVFCRVKPVDSSFPTSEELVSLQRREDRSRESYAVNLHGNGPRVNEIWLNTTGLLLHGRLLSLIRTSVSCQICLLPVACATLLWQPRCSSEIEVTVEAVLWGPPAA